MLGRMSNWKLVHVEFNRDYTINAHKAKGKHESGAGEGGNTFVAA